MGSGRGIFYQSKIGVGRPGNIVYEWHSVGREVQEGDLGCTDVLDTGGGFRSQIAAHLLLYRLEAAAKRY